MKKIAIISASIRIGRQSHKVALYFQNYLTVNKLSEAEILDLNEYKFPLFEERLSKLESPPPAVVEFAGKIRSADGIIIVTPEYNGGYPASLKNVIDLLTDEWSRKPVGLATVSDGNFGGSQVLMSLQFSLWKIRTWTVPAMFRVPNVDKTFDGNGNPVDIQAFARTTTGFINELFWCIEAKSRMKDYK